MKKVIIIIPYFGELPRWFYLHLKTCMHNPEIDWLFFTDSKKIPENTKNIRFIHMTMENFNLLASKKLYLNIYIKFPFKINDFKPTYGAIFSDYIKDYQYWGFADIDLIYGDIMKFIKKGIENNSDIISVRKIYLAGPFSLFKNSEKINRLYEKSRDYVKVFQNVNKYYCFDECNYLCSHLYSGGSIWDKKSEIESITHVIFKLLDKGLISYYSEKNMIAQDLNGWEKSNMKYLWKDGRLEDMNGQEIMMYHFIELKRDKGTIFSIPKNANINKGFFITRNGVFSNDDKYLKLRMKFRYIYRKALDFKVKVCSKISELLKK
jgi:hypothetical protein